MYIKIVIVSFLLLVLQHAVRVVYILGLNVTVYNHTPGPCKPVPGVDQGAEDMETLPNGLTFITSGHRWEFNSPHFKNLYKREGRKGKVLLVDFNHPDLGARELTLDPDFYAEDFSPHGISVIQDEETDKVTLFVVSHPLGRDTIEKFEFVPDKLMLKHIHTYAGDALRTVNDVAALDEHSFYFTNYAYSRTTMSFLFEAYLLLPWGSIVFFNGDTYETVADSLVLPNGILFSADKRTLYVANSLFNSMTFFNVEVDNRINVLQEYHLYTSADNFALDRKSGNLLTGCHPSIYLTAHHLDKPDVVRSPSQVLLLNMSSSTEIAGITELYSDDGTNLAASTVASLYDKKLLIGSVVDKLMYCEVRNLD